MGFLYLNSYLRQFGVPFPVDTVPTLLVAIGGISIFFVAIVAVYLILPGMANEFWMDDEIDKWENASNEGIYSFKYSNRIKRAVVIYTLPALLFLAILYAFRSPLTFLIFIVGYPVWGGLYGLGICRKCMPYDQRRKLIMKVSSYSTSIHILFLPSFIMFFTLVMALNADIGMISFVLMFLAYVSLNTICLIHVFSPKKIENVNGAEEIPKVDDFPHRPRFNFVYMTLGFLVVLSIIPNVSQYVGKVALRALNIGGEIKFVAKDMSDSCRAWPEFVIQKSDENVCISKVGKLILMLGDRAYALFERTEGDFKVVRLNLSRSAIVTDLPDTFYGEESR